jgi:phosphoribosylformylglycinamidine (FGAM) synthase PurS component
LDSKDGASLAPSFVRELVNENKESHKVSFDELKFEGGYVPVKVSLHIEDGEAISTRDRLRNRLGIREVKEVRRATVWKLYLRDSQPEALAKEIAERLLINPHKDSYEILG